MQWPDLASKDSRNLGAVQLVTKRVLGVLLIASVFANLFLLYGIVDQAVTIDDHASELARKQSQLDAATKLFRPFLKGQNPAALLSTAKKEKLEVLPKSGDEIYIEQVKFTLTQQGTISDLSFE